MPNLAWTGMVSTSTLSRKWAPAYRPRKLTDLLAILWGDMHSFIRRIRGAAPLPTVAGLALAMFSSPTLAQKPEAGEVESPGEELEELEEVMVTAQRRAENLMTTPIAAASLTENDLQKKGVVNLPLTDTLAGRIAVDVERRDSFFVNQGAQPGPTKTAYNSSYRSTQVHDIDATVLDLPALGAPHVEEQADTPETTVSQELAICAA
jgi:hypothetical protein